MAQGDFGVVPNVWRPQFVPPINTGEDTQAGIPGNSAANLGATETTITESFFNVPVVGWQQLANIGGLGASALAYTTISAFTLFTNTPRTLVIVKWRGQAGLVNLSFRFSAIPPFNGTFGTVTSNSGNNQVGFYSVLLSPMANLTYVTATPRTDGLTNVYATISYDTGTVADLTANTLQIIPQTAFNLIPVIDGPGTDPSFATELNGNIDTSIPINLQARVGAGSALVSLEVWKMGDTLLSV